MKSDLSNLKVGDRIWTIQEGWAEVVNNNYHQVNKIKTKSNAYLIDGKKSVSCKYPSAFTYNPFEKNEERVVLVRDSGKDDWIKRVLHMVKNGRFVCWINAETLEESKEEWRTTPWKYMKELPKYTRNQIKVKLKSVGLTIEDVKGLEDGK